MNRLRAGNFTSFKKSDALLSPSTFEILGPTSKANLKNGALPVDVEQRSVDCTRLFYFLEDIKLVLIFAQLYIS